MNDLQSATAEATRRFQFRLRTLLLFVLACAALCSLCASIAVLLDRAKWQRVPDPRPEWTIDATKPWKITFGRGSGMDGLDTATLESTGNVVAYRLRRTPTSLAWEKANVKLSLAAVSKVLAAVSSNGLLKMHKAYHARNVFDGTQWVLWITQGDKDKAVYFDNYFPDEISRFAEALDHILAQSELNNATWRPAPDAESLSHQNELWDSIKR